MNNKIFYSSQSGFTILEALIAAVILGLALSSVLAVSSQSFRYLADIRLTARSSQVLQQKMEDLRLLSWTDLYSASNTFVDFVHPTVFRGTLTRATYDSYGTNVTAALVTLTVTWTNRTTRVSTNRLSSIIANGGLNKYIF